MAPLSCNEVIAWTEVYHLLLEVLGHLLLYYANNALMLYCIFIQFPPKKEELCANIDYNWVYHTDKYQLPLLSFKGRDGDHFPKLH